MIVEENNCYSEMVDVVVHNATPHVTLMVEQIKHSVNLHFCNYKHKQMKDFSYRCSLTKQTNPQPT